MSAITDWEKKMEETWGRAFAHESGHALMAVLTDIPCNGICYSKTDKKFCTQVMLPSSTEYSKSHYLFLVAGSAAELIIYGDQDEGAARSDRVAFSEACAPPLDETVNEARAILQSKSRQLKRLRSMLKAKVRQADYNVSLLPEIGMDGSDAKFAVLLTEAELEDAVRRS
jgi:hypothetical protein